MLEKVVRRLQQSNVKRRASHNRDTRRFLYIFLGFILLCVIANFSRGNSKQTEALRLAASNDIAHISKLVFVFQSSHGRFPNESEWLLIDWSSIDHELLGERGLGEVPRDPWGNSYNYRFPAEMSTEPFDVWSDGNDGAAGGVGAGKDIVNISEELNMDTHR